MTGKYGEIATYKRTGDPKEVERSAAAAEKKTDS